MKIILKGSLMLVWLIAFGCGSGSKPASNPVGTGALVPLKVGNRWTYQVTDIDGTISAKVQGVTAEEPVGGTGAFASTVAFKLVTGNKFADVNGDVSYQGVMDSRLVRFREISIDGGSGRVKQEEYYDPPKLRVDDTMEHTTAGTSWPESYLDFVVDTPPATAIDGGQPTSDGGLDDAGPGLVTTFFSVIDVWKVISASDVVTVPAGTFKALALQRLGNSGKTDKTFWFVRGVGKIKESGVGDQTEELSSYSLTP